MSMFTSLQGASGRVDSAWHWVRSIPRRVVHLTLDKQKTLAESNVTVGEITARERQNQLARFYIHFEDLVELLCDSAQYGPDARMEQKYQELRTWMHRHYTELSSYVVAYLDIEVADTRVPLDLYGRSTDAFEALYAAPTLQEQLRGDDGSMIGRIMRTREALNRYAEQLRRLAA